MDDERSVLTSLDALAKLQENQRLRVLPDGQLRIEGGGTLQCLWRAYNADSRARMLAVVTQLVTQQTTHLRTEWAVIASMREVCGQSAVLVEDVARRQTRAARLEAALRDARGGLGKLMDSTYKDDSTMCTQLRLVLTTIDDTLSCVSSSLAGSTSGRPG